MYFLFCKITVSTNFTLKSRESWDCSDSDNSTTVPSSESTRPPLTCSRRSSPSSLLDTPLDRPSRSSSSREVSLRLTDRESLLPITPSSRRLSALRESTALKISFTNSSPSDLTSRKPTTSSGPSSSIPPEVVSTTRDTLSTKVVIGVTERSSSTISSRLCSEQTYSLLLLSCFRCVSMFFVALCI